MNTEPGADGSGELGKESAVVALSGLVEKVFAATVVGPVLNQIGLTIGDQFKYYRMKNLIRLNRHLEEVIKERNLDKSDLKNVSLSVGFPLLEKASYQDDDALQRNWANLLASAMNKDRNGDDGFNLSITYIEILHQFSRLDCEVLEYIAENGVFGRDREEGSLMTVALDPKEIRKAFPDRLAHISLEKIVNLGCAYRVLRTPLSTTGGDGYGALQQDIIVTLIGLNLYVAASGKKPKWYDVYTPPEDSPTTS